MSQALKIYFMHKPNWFYFTLLAAGMGYSIYSSAWLNYWYLLPVLVVLIPFIEFFTHKYFLHMPRPQDPQQHPRWAWIADHIHYLHHQEPKKVAHIFAEWWMTIPMLGLYILATFLLTQSLAITVYFNSLLVAYFLVYEWTHFMAHFDGYSPRTKYGQYMKKFHLWHHYKHEDYWYGITSPVADYVFGTWLDPKSVQASELALKNRGRI